MAGWNLNEGSIPFQHYNTDQVFRLINSFYSPSVKRTTSYKFAFFKALLDNVFNLDPHNPVLTFPEVFEKFTEIYWNQVLCHCVRQSPLNPTSIEKILSHMQEQYFPHGSVPLFEVLREDYQAEAIRGVAQIGRKYVIGALYADAGGQLYSFSKQTNTLIFNPSVLVILIQYKSFFERLNFFEWEKYLEKCNEGLAIPYGTIFENITKRSNLDRYRSFLLAREGGTCFYCHKKIESTPAVDHFIPWSFVRDDKLWNFVLACPKCNSRKSDYLLPDTSTKELISRNRRIITYDDMLVKNDFTQYTEDRIPSMFESALGNGWQQLHSFPFKC